MSTIEMKIPVIGESVKEVTLSAWLKADGDFVQKDEIICAIDSDKASLEVVAEQSGILHHKAQEGDDIAIGAVFATIDTSASGGDAPKKETTAPPAVKEDTPVKKEEQNSTYATGHPSPAARKLMDENKLSSEQVQGTGKDGRITKEDVLNTVAQTPAKTEAKTETKAEPKAEAPAPKVAALGNFSRNTKVEKMSRMRRTISQRLVSAKNNTAMLTTFNEVDMTAIFELRKKYQDDFVAKYGTKLGFMSLFAKACAKVLMEMPEVNAQIVDEGKSIQYHDYADISIAISTPTGLVVPPVHNVESLSLAEIENKIGELAKKAREGKLTLEEMSGGTFTITNGGVFGSMMSTPIINEPQSAILGMHAIQERPMVVNGQIVVRPMMYLALSYDHRIIDGSSSVTFLVKVKKLLEDPMRLFLL